MTAHTPEDTFGRARVLLGLRDTEAQAELVYELMQEGYLVDHAETALQMTARLLAQPCELIIVDADLPADNVLDAIAKGPDGPCVIVITRTLSDQLLHQARQLRAVLIDNFAGPRDLADCAVNLVPATVTGGPLRFDEGDPAHANRSS
jgi:DNA-binding response OmpR family regulator